MLTRALILVSSMSFVLSSCSLYQPSAPAPAPLRLQIIHINDTHSQFDASPATVAVSAEKPLYTVIGGHPRLLTHARRLREQAAAEGLSSLFLHGGDAFKGSAYFELFEQTINIDILNRMQIDAMALGNHEFDIGLAKLADFSRQVNFPLLAANVDSRNEPHLATVANFKPYQLFSQIGQRWQPIAEPLEHLQPVIAVMGLALEDMRSLVSDTGALVFEAEVAAAQATVAALEAQGVKHIVALTHLGHQRDLRLASKVNGIDVIVGGHSHTLLGDFRHWFLGLQAPYAQQVPNPNGEASTCIVQAGQFAQAVGALEVMFDENGRIVSCQGENTLLASKHFYHSPLRQSASLLQGKALQQAVDTVGALPRTAITEEDPLLRQVLDEVYLPAVQQAYGRQISATTARINHVRLPGTAGSDQHGSTLAAYITDGMHYWLNAPAQQAVLGQPVDLTLIGAGNIRSSLEAGAIYEGHIRLEVLPFDAPLSVLTVTGSDILDLLYETIVATLPTGAHAGKFPYTSHLRYTATELADGQLQLSDVAIYQQGQWQPLVEQARYRLATTNYLANGNDGWQRLQQVQQRQTDRQDIILLNGQPKAYAVERVIAQPDAQGQRAFIPQYTKVTALPCNDPGVDCKVAAQAFIEYLSAHPMLFQQARPATVTLLRP